MRRPANVGSCVRLLTEQDRPVPNRTPWAASQPLGYFYFEEDFGRRSVANLLTRDEARGWRRTSPSCRSWCGGLEPPDSDYSLFIFRSTHALTSKYFACSPNSARQSLIACILVLGAAWIAVTEKVSTAITASPGNIAHQSTVLRRCILPPAINGWLWRRARPDEFQPLQPQCQR